MTEAGEGRGAIVDDRAVDTTTVRALDQGPGFPGRRHAAPDGTAPDHGWNAPDPLGDQAGDAPGPDVTVRRRTAEAAVARS